MIDLNNGPDKPHRKCARIVGDTMGKYHPHGDSSIYGALVYMAQEWSMRYPLVDGHGNFGSVDGDGAAAMRYTEARLSKISMEMLADINKDTVDFAPNFDETEKEPTVLPSRFPNLLVNGTTGIAVGMATNIPPHNLREVIAAVVKIIDNRVEEGRDTSIEEVMNIIKGPDFPTGAQILGTRGISEAYRTGRGKIRVRAVTDIETLPSGKSRIVITELPYLVNKARLIEKMAQLVKDKKIDGITGITDESSREGMRVTIDVRRDANANVILNRLYMHTQLQDTFGVIMLALIDNKPKVLNLLEMLNYYLKHQEDVVTRRTRYDLNKAQERAHILKGLLIALDNIDEVIRIIRSSETVQLAKEGLMISFGLDDVQAQAIVDMRLRTLTGLERSKIQAEYDALMKTIEELKAILADENLLLGVIRKELIVISDKYGDDRRTKIGIDVNDFEAEDLIEQEDVVITVTKLGYIKRMSDDNFRSQNRGGKGIRGIQTLKEDYIDQILMTDTHADLMFFTNKGRVYRLKAYEIPEAGRAARGTAIVNLLQLQGEENVTAVIAVGSDIDINPDDFLTMITRKGMIKRTAIREYANVRKNGLNAISLREGDELIDVKATDGKKDIILVTRKGMSIRFHESDGRAVGRTSIGVRAIKLSEGDEVVGIIVSDEAPYVLIVTENGMGKRTRVEEFRAQARGGRGVKCYKITPRTGELTGAMAVDTDDEIIMISSEGVIIRMSCENISVVGRITSGVRLMDLGEGDKVASIEKVRETVSRDKDLSEDTEEEIDEDAEESEEEWSGEETDPESGDE
jgi:DNA gyrase subunit A